MNKEEYIGNRTNGFTHSYTGTKLGHFSQITSANKDGFPLLNNASPTTYTVKAGDVLYIPGGWWHWIRSQGDRCLSVNYWFSEQLEEAPTHHKQMIKNWPAMEKWTNDYLAEAIDNVTPDGVWVWFENSAYRNRMTAKEFISKYSRDSSSDSQKSKEFAYLVTLEDHEHTDSTSNRRILDALKGDVSFPFDNDIDPHFNFWLNFGGMETGLHYDTGNGILCVIDGVKEVTLYPPSDTQYLSPYPEHPQELIPINREFMYNLYMDMGEFSPHTDVSISKLLELTLYKAPNLGKYARQLQDRFGSGNIVYGIKNHDGVVKWEFYFYGLDRFNKEYQDRSLFFKDDAHNGQISLDKYLEFHRDTLGGNDFTDLEKIDTTGLTVFSVDFDEESCMLGGLTKLNLYYATTQKVIVPFLLREETWFPDYSHQKNRILFIDAFSNTFSSIDSIVRTCYKLGIAREDIQNLVKFCNYSMYKCSSTTIVNKRTEIGAYFFGIQYSVFLQFLIEYKYPPELVSLVNSNPESIKKLQLEVGLHFPKGSDTGIPSRTAFYGLF